MIKLDWCKFNVEPGDPPVSVQNLTTAFGTALYSTSKDIYYNFHCEASFAAWCPLGTPTLATGLGGTLCDTATVDCSSCNAGYTMSATAVSGSAQTCIAYAGDCTNGALITQSSRTQNHHCGSCS